MKKNSFALTAALLSAVLAASSACKKSEPAPAPPPDCEKGTHQEGNNCVPNEPAAVSTAAPLGAPAAK